MLTLLEYNPLGGVQDWMWLAGTMGVMMLLVFWMLLKRAGINLFQ